MDNQDWYRLGEQVGDLVERAIDSNDYKQLSQTLAKTIDSATQGLSRSWRNGSSAWQQAENQVKMRREQQTRTETDSVKGSGTVSAAGYSQMILGYVMTAVFALGFAGLGIIQMLIGKTANLTFPMICSLVLGAGGLFLALKGKKKVGLIKIQKQILQLMGNRDVCTIEELAAGTGKSRHEIVGDIKSMIQNQMFAGGAYLDEAETCLMTSREAYKQYQETEGAYRARAAAQKKQQEEQKTEGDPYAQYSDEIRQILTEGQDFIKHIHECNEEISGEEMSDKLSRLENVVTRIVGQVAKDPKSAPDLHKMMTYYLPVTRKLVDAYVNLDKQQVTGQNISATKQEIEKSLETINTAFENLLDSFFQDTAWDISTDISVMTTMMAQDGLMNKDFKQQAQQ